MVGYCSNMFTFKRSNQISERPVEVAATFVGHYSEATKCTNPKGQERILRFSEIK